MRRIFVLIVITLSWIGLGPAQADTWRIQTVDSGVEGYYTSLALDSGGYPHISYRFGGLKYAAWNGSGWDTHTVDPANVAWYSNSLALDPSGYAHISYSIFWPNYDLKYAYEDSSGWHVETVDSGGDVGFWGNSLALDSNGCPHIGYWDITNQDLKYTVGTWNTELESWDWAFETVDSAGNVGKYTSLALDSSDNACISYHDSGNRTLKYAAWNPSTLLWDIETVDTGEYGMGVGEHTSLALDSSDYPCIGYYSDEGSFLKYAAWDGSDWDIKEVERVSFGSGGLVGLALDSSDYPHMSYYQPAGWDRDLRYAAWNGTSWDIETVASLGPVPEVPVSLALDDDGFVHIGYKYGGLKYANNVPEPGTIALFGLGLLGLGAKLRRRNT